ncbi:FAD-dependent pyridine nucleotide-disulphide oxidoreductase [Xylanimonas cellulosilytica DSM 15894]|uniref:FAD-dependent pyridine nucleotide-disulphide oxidoreductase n=1 Tax=Xylanimonas cellulosilytica (strain DSM 15894 / JCM 12276 / CECT 5975 / KCTC 9989 / LMG 20990 / NBRC 107835 / XIL07) TaxID=446471 RepID=D1BZT5_XYLCX|nr:FAD/NAD(P)-binding oxidoreductase [Xylanimonas cellulosilytica]ACZ32063.1 FAD-dependent pyridine nucleotide-disulphide oxidoreductase [Xylanimonas cellulosilytica DSM 15894]
MASEPIVVVGGGLAAARAVETLRTEGFDGDVVVVTSEPHRPYERPPLSKDYLRGQAERESVFPLGEDWYREHAVEVRTHATAVGLSATEHRLTLADGATLPFGKLLLATGSTPRPLQLPGNDLRGVHLLRTLDDADRLSGALLQASLEGTELHEGPARVAVVGDGWIGLEVAASARQLGLDVTVIGRDAHPLEHVLGPELGEVFAQLHERHDVRLHRHATVTGFTGSDGQVTGVDMADGTHVDASIVVVGVGVTPNVGLAEAAGLDLRDAAEGGGVAVDGTLRTSHPDVWAAGDIASIPSPTYGRPLRVEHWARANDSGPHAARAMLGAADEYDILPYFFTDQFELGMEYTGWVDGPGGYDDVVLSGDPAGEAFAFWLRDGRVQAGMGLNVWDRMPEVEALIRSGKRPDRATLEAFVP